MIKVAMRQGFATVAMPKLRAVTVVGSSVTGFSSMGSGTWVVVDTTSVTFASGACLTSSMTPGSRGGTAAVAVPSVGAKETVAARKQRTRTPMVIIWLKLAILVEFDLGGSYS